MGYGKDFEMYLVDFKFKLPRMKKSGNRKQSPAMDVVILSRQNSFSQNCQASTGPNGENTVGNGNRDQNAQNCTNSGEEQLIAFGEDTIENVGMGNDKNPRTVTFELSQAKNGTSSSAATPPPLVPNGCLSN